jgi:hypothetical protein
MISFHVYTVAICLTATVASALVNPSLETFGRISSRFAVTGDFDRPSTFLDEDAGDDDISITFVDESGEEEEGKREPQGRKRWENLNPKVKQRMIEQGEEKAIANKKKREPAQDKKRRKCLFADV